MADVRIYTKPGCPYCAAAKDDLKKRGVEYDEFDVKADPKNAQAALEYSGGQRIVPIIVTGDDIKLGFGGG